MEPGHRRRVETLAGYQLAAIVDFRTEIDRRGDGGPNRIPDGPTCLELEMVEQAVFARFLDVVADRARRPVLWHCSAGKDRAGWAATLVGLTLGELIDQYVAANIHRPVEQRLAYCAERGVDAWVLRPFLQVDASYQRAGLAAIDQRWPSRQGYLDQPSASAPPASNGSEPTCWSRLRPAPRGTVPKASAIKSSAHHWAATTRL